MNEEENVDFVLSTEDDNIGGLSKFPDNSPGNDLSLTVLSRPSISLSSLSSLYLLFILCRSVSITFFLLKLFFERSSLRRITTSILVHRCYVSVS